MVLITPSPRLTSARPGMPPWVRYVRVRDTPICPPWRVAVGLRRNVTTGATPECPRGRMVALYNDRRANECRDG